MPPIFAASSREAPSSTAAIANSRRACAASFARWANRRTELVIGDHVAGDIEQRYLVRGKFDRQGAFAVGREGCVRDAVAHCDGVDQLDLGTLDREHADRLVLAIGDEGQSASRIDAQPRRLLPNRDRADSLGRIGLESMTWTLSSGTCFKPSPSLITLMESATSAIEPEGSMSRLTGGPTTEFFSGIGHDLKKQESHWAWQPQRLVLP
jgi:hypothetical protein